MNEEDVLSFQATCKADWVLRTFQCKTKDIMTPLWKTLINPHLYYCAQLWCSANRTGDISELAEPLKFCSKQIARLWNKTYWEWLSYLKLDSMQ